MRLGPKEKAVLRALDFTTGEWTPPSRYMLALGGYGSCPCSHTLNRLVEKGLVEFRATTMTRQEHRDGRLLRKPGRETAEHNAALRLTVAGCQKRFEIDGLLHPPAGPARVDHLVEDLPF